MEGRFFRSGVGGARGSGRGQLDGRASHSVLAAPVLRIGRTGLGPEPATLEPYHAPRRVLGGDTVPDQRVGVAIRRAAWSRSAFSPLAHGDHSVRAWPREHA